MLECSNDIINDLIDVGDGSGVGVQGELGFVLVFQRCFYLQFILLFVPRYIFLLSNVIPFPYIQALQFNAIPILSIPKWGYHMRGQRLTSLLRIFIAVYILGICLLIWYTAVKLCPDACELVTPVCDVLPGRQGLGLGAGPVCGVLIVVRCVGTWLNLSTGRGVRVVWGCGLILRDVDLLVVGRATVQGLVLAVLLIGVFGRSFEAFGWCHANVVMVDLVLHHGSIGSVCGIMTTTTMVMLSSASPSSITVESCLLAVVVAEVLWTEGVVPWCGSDAGCTVFGR
jgi:hypothetical protein